MISAIRLILRLCTSIRALAQQFARSGHYLCKALKNFKIQRIGIMREHLAPKLLSLFLRDVQPQEPNIFAIRASVIPTKRNADAAQSPSGSG